MRTLKLTLEYDGTRYSGWQEQTNARTIAGELHKAAEDFFGRAIELGGAGRTDAGVHAVVIDPLASNARAHAFYRRLGFVPEERRRFGDDADDCLVHRLRREDWRARLPGDARLVVQPPNILFRNS